MFSLRLFGTIGTVALGVALGAILVSQDVAGWVVGLTISAVTVLLMGVLWSYRGV